MTDERAVWTPFMLRLASKAAKDLIAADMAMAEAALVLYDIAKECGAKDARENYERLMACVTIGSIQYWRSFPDEIIDKPNLGKTEQRILGEMGRSGKSAVALMLEAIEYAQQRTEAIAEGPRAKRHGRR